MTASRRRKRPLPCHCLGWWFPHRRGCKYCVDYPKVLTDEDWENPPRPTAGIDNNNGERLPSHLHLFHEMLQNA